MTVHPPRGARLAAALVPLVAVILPLAASAQVPPPAAPQWSTYLGGTAQDRITAVTQLGDGEVLVVGTTSSQNLAPNPPLAGPHPNGLQIFVAHADPDGNTNPDYPFVSFGGSGADEPLAVTFGSNSELFIVGKTTSPTASVSGAGAVLRAAGSGTDAFVARIGSDGFPDWFMFLSGSGEDVATGVIYLGGSVYVSGWTDSNDFLGRTGPIQGGMNGFVVRVEPTEATATIGWGGVPQIIGGAGTDTLRGITSGLGNKLVAVGTTTSAIQHLDKITNNFQGGRSDAFAMMMNPASGALEWLTFVGGDGDDEGNAIAQGQASSFVVAGTTTSSFGFVPPPPAGKNAFVTWLNEEGRPRSVQVRGGSSDDEALAVTTDTYGTAYVGGKTGSADFRGAASGFDPVIDSGTGPREGFVWVAPAEGGDGWASFVGGAGIMDVVRTLSLRFSNRLILGLETDSATGLPGPFVYDSTPSTPNDGYLVSVAVSDPVPPGPVGEVYDRPQQDDEHEDIEETTSTSSIFANWTAFTDTQTGIVKYEWAIGTLQEPTLISPFTSVGTQLSAAATGLTLTPGEQYVVTVRAQNGHGLTSIARSNGVTVLPPPPPPDGGTDGGNGETDGGNGGTDGGTDGGTGGKDGGTDGGTGGPDGGGGGPGEPESPLGWEMGCASAGGAALPLLIGLFALMLLGRRFGQR